MKNVHILISGFVQGIGFRSWTKSQARSLGLTGWVRNLPDGRLELMVQGKEEKLRDLLKLLKEGPPLSKVEEIKSSWQETAGDPPAGGFSDFEIR